jgi:hypothetical protein
MSVSSALHQKSARTVCLFLQLSVLFAVLETYVMSATLELVCAIPKLSEMNSFQRSMNSPMSAARKRALLIGSPFGDLRGPLNDAELMATVLEAQGFENVKCCDTQAINENIQAKWIHLINQSNAGDAVVIYYSGHGGIADCGQGTLAGNGDCNDTRPWRYQFIVPMKRRYTNL